MTSARLSGSRRQDLVAGPSHASCGGLRPERWEPPSSSLAGGRSWSTIPWVASRLQWWPRQSSTPKSRRTGWKTNGQQSPSTIRSQAVAPRNDHDHRRNERQAPGSADRTGSGPRDRVGSGRLRGSGPGRLRPIRIGRRSAPDRDDSSWRHAKNRPVWRKACRCPRPPGECGPGCFPADQDQRRSGAGPDADQCRRQCAAVDVTEMLDRSQP